MTQLSSELPIETYLLMFVLLCFLAGVIKGPYEFAKDQQARDLKAKLIAKCGQEQRRQLKHPAKGDKIHTTKRKRISEIVTPACEPVHDEVVENPAPAQQNVDVFFTAEKASTFLKSPQAHAHVV